MTTIGKNVVVACLALCMGWCLAQPTRVSVTVPDYVVERVGNVDHVSIPGGQMLVEEDGSPVVPYSIRTVELPAGWRVQDVVLKSRTGMRTDSGLRLPTVQPDSGPAVPALKRPFPDREFGWSARYEKSPALHIFVYPFRYEPATGQAQFYKEHEFEVRYARSTVRLKSVASDRAACEPGDTARLEVVFENTGPEQHASVTVVALRVGKKPVEVASRDASIGRSDTLPFAWHTRGVATGVYDVEVVVRDPEGNELDRNGTTLRVGIPRGEITAFRVEPDVFRVGDDIKLVAEFTNTGSCDLVGTAVFLIEKGDEPVDEMREEMARTKPGASRTFRKTWSSAGAEKSAVYTAAGYVEYEGTACEPARATFSTNRMPAASFTMARDTVAVGEDVAFDAAGSTDSDGMVAGFRWDFGDGGKAEGARAEHTWMQPGDYVVRLSVVDNEGGTGTVTKDVVVEEQR
jgi:plastocyanin